MPRIRPSPHRTQSPYIQGPYTQAPYIQGLYSQDPIHPQPPPPSQPGSPVYTDSGCDDDTAPPATFTTEAMPLFGPSPAPEATPPAPPPAPKPIIRAIPTPPAPIATMSMTIVNAETISGGTITTTQQSQWIIKTTAKTATTTKTTVTTTVTSAYGQETTTTNTCTSTSTQPRQESA